MKEVRQLGQKASDIYTPKPDNRSEASNTPKKQ
jgi:hypothetical protein